MKKISSVTILFLLAFGISEACTSMLVSAATSANGRPMMWKHRDTGTEHNFIERVQAKEGNMAYVALYNGGDSLLVEAWMGMNESGFSIMNTASYNLAPDTTEYKDREGIVMTRALSVCRSVQDFANLLDTLPKPLGVQANFGVMDANGDMAYFETDDFNYTKFDMADAENGVIVRTNYSVSGNDTDGHGYIRYQTVYDLLGENIQKGNIEWTMFTDNLSKSFWHSLLQKDFEKEPGRWVVDRDFIPRRISSASIVIEGVTSPDDLEDIVMHTMIGYPPCSDVIDVSIDSVPDCLRPLEPGWRCAKCNEVVELKHQVFPINRGSGQNYIDMDLLRRIMNDKRNNR